MIDEDFEEIMKEQNQYIEELEAELSESEALLAKAVRLISEKPILATYEDDVQWQKYVIAELTSSEAANGEAKGGKDE